MTDVATKPHLRSWAFTAPNKILVATDLTDIDYLVPHAKAQCEASGASLVLSHVVPPVESTSLDAAVLFIVDAAKATTQRHFAEAQETLGGVAAKMRADGIDCEVVVRYGHPRDVVQELVSHVHAERVVLGTHGRRNLKKFFLGSTANEILKSVNVPVWTVGPHARPFAHGQPCRILHPVSLSSGYQETAKLAVKLGQFYKAEITLLHVLPRDVHAEYAGERLVRWTAFELGRLIPDEAPLWTTATISVEAGEIVEQILSTAEKLRADLIVMGSNPDTAFWPVHGDNTVYNVIAEAKCPVLTLRHSIKVDRDAEATSERRLVG
ncbi:MAG: universal stress protein [Acidobacteriaceae bacterium]